MRSFRAGGVREMQAGLAYGSNGTADYRLLDQRQGYYVDRDALYAALDRLHTEHRFTTLIAGGARGADTLAAQWAEDRGIQPGQGRKAGPLRYNRMLDEGHSDLVVAFPGGKGTAGMMALSRKAGIEVITP
jgi:hypothetical protein